MDELVAAVKVLVKGTTDGDYALLELCKAIIERLLSTENVVAELHRRIMALEDETKQLSERVDLLLEVIKTSSQVTH